MEREVRSAARWFMIAGLLILARETIGLFDPAYYDPVSPIDYAAAWLTTVAAVAVAIALFVWWRSSPIRRGSLVVALAAVGSALFGIGNMLEDVVGVDSGETIFFVGGLTMFGALIVAGIVALTVNHPLRWSGLFLLAYIAGWAFPDSGGLWFAGSALIGLGGWLLRDGRPSGAEESPSHARRDSNPQPPDP